LFSTLVCLPGYELAMEISFVKFQVSASVIITNKIMLKKIALLSKHTKLPRPRKPNKFLGLQVSEQKPWVTRATFGDLLKSLVSY
jgi:hypothetical protein